MEKGRDANHGEQKSTCKSVNYWAFAGRPIFTEQPKAENVQLMAKQEKTENKTSWNKECAIMYQMHQCHRLKKQSLRNPVFQIRCRCRNPEGMLQSTKMCIVLTLTPPLGAQTPFVVLWSSHAIANPLHSSCKLHSCSLCVRTRPCRASAGMNVETNYTLQESNFHNEGKMLTTAGDHQRGRMRTHW